VPKTSKILRAAAVAALIATSLYGAVAHRAAADEKRVNVRIPDNAKPESFEEQITNGQVTGMTVIKKGGAREIMQPQPKPTCNSGCPPGEHLKCWTDHVEQMSVCVCEASSPGGGGGGGGHGGVQIDIESFSWSEHTL
jgi:hypothetical protein